MKRLAFICLIFICSAAARAQSNRDSCSLEISLITVGPGNDLDALFGHTAIRVRDTTRGMDIVYNYGTFDAQDPLFYVHFTRGIMNYSLSAATFADFMMEYEFEHRPVLSQILNLNCKEKISLYEALRNNTLEENRFYQYHFHTDNCTTRAGRIMEANTTEKLVYANVLPPNNATSRSPLTFRDMINEYLDKQHADWSEWGIDLLLGMNLDAKVSNVEAIHFLPDYLYRGVDSARTGEKDFVLARQTLLQFPEAHPSATWFTPMVLAIFIFLLNLILYFLKKSKALLIFDIIFFSLLALVGILIVYLWLGRVDNVCRDNMNILWALPTHIIAVFFLRRNDGWIRYYFLITAVLASILLLGFAWWPQRLPLAIIPILATIICRGFYLYHNRRHGKNAGV